MNAVPERDARGEHGDAGGQEGLRAIEQSFLDGLEADKRLDSGVPEKLQSDPLDFIQMTGLTRSPRNNVPAGETEFDEAPEYLDPLSPLSFFEHGVADVDPKMTPYEVQPGLALRVPASRTASAFEDLIGVIKGERPAGPLPPGDGEGHEAEAGFEALVRDLGGAAPNETEDVPVAQDFDNFLEAEAAAPAPLPAHDALAEAEELLHALENQPRDDAPLPESMPSDSSPEEVETSLAALPLPERPSRHHEAQLEYDYSAAPVRRRSRGHSRWRKKTLRRLLIAGSVLIVACLLTGAYLWWVRPAVLTAGQLWDQGQSRFAAGKFREASADFTVLARRYPDYLMRPEAQFMAAYAQWLAPAASPAEAAARNRKALEMFGVFRAENPKHPKQARAEIMQGILLEALGEHTQAIAVLEDVRLLVSDPEAVLPIQRTLAKAYGSLGQTQEAEEAYLQAAAMESNFTADEDYYALGALYLEQAEAAKDQTAAGKLAERAGYYWTRATQVPGIDPRQRERILGQLKGLRAGEILATGAPETAPTEEAAPDMDADAAAAAFINALTDVDGPEPVEAETDQPTSPGAADAQGLE